MAFSFSSLIYTLFFLVFAVQATPLALEARNKLDVFVPRIIEPNSDTVWTVGQEAIVVWDTSDAPADISNSASVILNDVGVVAQGFDLRAGNVTFKVPLSTSLGPHFITLFGDSGNYSPVFTVEA
ncbi:hypothetical protein CPB84DRAFT_1761327 [Gymnopilus junonius]|uniref:Uncharacterized protein n=1 Tax=Gymnopilus junonius TaxID=109634 RepID=A0A9P5NZV5_GYMJU|nr:hypothetical protein CPB84DRAFT_1761327 [Gymnopilus junonius]